MVMICLYECHDLIHGLLTRGNVFIDHIDAHLIVVNATGNLTMRIGLQGKDKNKRTNHQDLEKTFFHGKILL